MGIKNSWEAEKSEERGEREQKIGTLKLKRKERIQGKGRTVIGHKKKRKKI